MPLNPLRDPAELQRAIGWQRKVFTNADERDRLRQHIALKLAAAGMQTPEGQSLASFSKGMLDSLKEKNRLLGDYRAPVDRRIEAFLSEYFSNLELSTPLQVPSRSLVLDRHGMARELSLPVDGDSFKNSLVDSKRVKNGIINNPLHDRRTTAGTFHIVEGGLPIPGDKRAVPKSVFAKLFQAAVNAPDESLGLPYLCETQTPAKAWLSLLLRPLVCPEVPGVCPAQTLETRFFVPASLASNLDFVESIFGNAGDPLVPANDAALDAKRWSGHTGCVILAPHLTTMKKKDLGLPYVDDATDRQRQDQMCWSDPDEFYNGGSAFKLTCRDERGVVVTLIADNYYGYCKKEVKTQISYAANLMGGVEEEHAGGALAFASYSLGNEFKVNSRRYNGRTFADVASDYESFVDVKEEGYGVDRNWPSVIYIPEDARVSLTKRCVEWEQDSGQVQQIPLSPDNIYVAPSGYQIRLEKHPAAPSWRLVGTVGEGIFCHKPCTVSGGGKSEISKSLRDYMLYGPIFVVDREADFAILDQIFDKDYVGRWRSDYNDKPVYSAEGSRKFLDPERSVGSCIKLLAHSKDFSNEYNDWLAGIPDHIFGLAFIIKRFTKPGMEAAWREHFGVDIVNGSPGHQLKVGKRSLVGTYLRIGLAGSSWRTFKLRQDFIAAAKVQMEDDISASTVIADRDIEETGPAVTKADSYKFVANCEYRLFQRPDDAVHRGLDKQTEIDLSRPGNFISNFEPLTSEQAQAMVENVVDFDQFTQPMQDLIQSAADNGGFVCSSDAPRLVDGVPTKNPRYLQDRPDMIRARETYMAQVGMRLFRALPMDKPVHVPVGAILSGRRNNPPVQKQGIRSLAVYSPLHYQELPELMMDYVCSLTGKSPSTTGAGSEGALTKGPFNMLMTTADLNASLISMVLTGLGGFSTPAGHVGPNYQIGHDISLLIPEVWCRMGPSERDPNNLIAKRMLTKIDDFEHNGKKVLASRLGYRVTERFLTNYVSRVFDNPAKVFPEDLLQPELQDLDSFADGVNYICEAHERVAKQYFEDGSLELACPPLQALLSIMANGSWNGMTIDCPAVRHMFTREYLLASDWYQCRLVHKQQTDIKLWRRKLNELEACLNDSSRAQVVIDLDLQSRRDYAAEQLERVESAGYLDELVGTLGADPMVPISAGVPMLSAEVSTV